MWWFGVPKGLQNVQDITYTRVEKLTKSDNHQPFTPAGSSQFTFTNAQGYGQVSQKKYNKPEEWTNISNFYFTGDKVLASKGWKQLLGIDGGKNKGYDDTGNTAQQWTSYKGETAGLQGIFVDWESAGQRYYDMTYVAEMTDDAWEKRDENPLRFAAGVYRYAGNWHYAVGQKHDTPRIADHLKLQYPAVTKVKNLKKLSNDEKGKVKEAIENVNRGQAGAQTLFDKLVKDGQDGIVVNDDGSATITFKDKTTRTIPASILVAQDELDSDRYKPQMPELTPVVNPNKITKSDKEAVLKAFKDKNKDNKDFNDHLKSGDDGIKFVDDAATGTTKLVVTYKDGSTLEIPSSDLVRQGATIASWAPYVVPDYMEVDNLKQLTTAEVNTIVSAFDTANQGITPYDESKTQNSNKAPVTVNQTTGDATIMWKDGSTTTIEAWQFLKEKVKTPAPQPQTPTSEEKTFIVESSDKPTVVTFDPFKTTSAEISSKNIKTQLDGLKTKLKALTAKDSQDNTKSVTITDVEFSVDNDGVGYITFKADGYKDAKYPMGTFFKQNANSKVLPQNGTTTNSQDRKGYKYNLRKFAIKGQTPTTEEKNAAVKQFVGDNYDGTVNDCIGGTYYLNANLTPKPNTLSLKPSKNRNDGLISYIKADDSTIKFYGTNGNVLDTINDVYLTNQGGSQSDTTLADLKALAKKLLTAKQQAGVTNKDLKKAGITDPANLSNADKGIDKMDEKTLRDLIQKLTDAKHYDRKYNTPTLEVDNPDNLTEDNLKAAIKAFLEANYDNADTVNVTSTSDFALPTTLTPKKDTVYMEVGPDGVTKIKSAGKDGIVVVDGDSTTTFTVKPTYTKKAAPEPAPKPGEKSKLDKMKEKAKELIERNPNLTPDQKKQYKQQVDDAKDENGVHTAVNNANEQAKKNKTSADPSTQQTINNNKKGTTAQQQADNDQKEKDKKEREQKQEQQLQNDKTNAENTINNMPNLSDDDKNKLKQQLNGDSTPANPNGATTPEDVQKIINNAQAINDAKADLKVDALPFLCHGDSNNADDKALKDLIGADVSKKDAALTKIDELLKKTTPAPATAKELNDAVANAKRQNDINETNAKQFANAKLNKDKQDLDAAYNALNDTQKAAVKDKYEAATTAITSALDTVNKATKPSQIKDALNIDTTIKAAKNAISTQVSNTQQTNKKQQENDNKDALAKEKQAQIARINNSGLSDEDKNKAIKDIKNATKLGDPTGIANRAIKAQKIKDALKKIDDFKHLNKAQKDAFKEIINSTDANEHKNDDGTTTDDIDDVLANATATDTAMARLETLKQTADEFAKGDKYKNSNDKNKKDAFDAASTTAGSVLDKAKGDAKSADDVNTIYNNLLKAMQAIDNTVKGAGVSTDALSKEIEADKGLKPDDKADPKTQGDPLYTTASKEKQTAFDKALSDAEAALKTANDDNANQAKPGSTPRTPEQEAKAQKAVDEALQKLKAAREALDGVNTQPLQDAVSNADETHKSVKYTNASKDKRDAYDNAIKEGQALLDRLNGTTQAQPGQGEQQPGGQGGQEQKLDTKEAKQKALDAALKKIQDAYAALDGAAPMIGYPMIAVIPSGSVDNGNAQAPATPSTPSADANASASTEAGAAAESSESSDANEAAAVAPSRTKGHGKHARIAQTSDPFTVGALAAPFAALAGALSLGSAGSRKRLRFAKHLKR